MVCQAALAAGSNRQLQCYLCAKLRFDHLAVQHLAHRVEQHTAKLMIKRPRYVRMYTGICVCSLYFAVSTM